jgi:hypothetical protein
MTTRTHRFAIGVVVATAALCLTACSSAGTSGSAGTSTAGSSAASASAAVPSPSASAGTDVALGAGSELPDSWPAELPPYPEGQLASVVVADGGAAINAVWSTQTAGEDAFATMEQALLAKGFVTSKDAGREDMLVTGDGLRSNDYVSSAYDVNVTVSWDAGGTTVAVNASPA